MNGRKMIVFFWATMVVFSLFSCKKNTTTTQTKSGFNEIRKRGYLTIATSPDYPPFEFLEEGASLDDLEGVEIEIIAKVAEDMNLKLRYITMDYTDIMQGVIHGLYDLGVSGYIINPDRADVILYSSPHSIGGLRMVVPLVSGVKGIENLNKARIVALNDSSASDYCQAKGFKTLLVNSNAEAISTLVEGKADVWIGDNVWQSIYINRYNSEAEPQNRLAMLDDILTREEYAFITSKNNEELIVEINKSLRRLRDDGTIARIFAKYDMVYNESKDYIRL